MPIPLPNLDDRTFADLSAELRSLIPRHDKTWTNHNPSDPGITFIELFAWLGEMLLYRMNSIDHRTSLTFLKRIGVQPGGQRADLTFVIDLPKADLPAGFVLRRGTRVASRDNADGTTVEFETTADVPASDKNWDKSGLRWIFTVPSVRTGKVAQEELGASTGSANQEFTLKQGPLFLVPDWDSYDDNPAVTVDKEAWIYKADLLQSGPGDNHFTADALASLIRFGDGTRGRVPAAGARIVCSYRHTAAADHEVAAGAIASIVKLHSGVAVAPALVSVFNERAATGGPLRETLDDLLARGAAALTERTRAISTEDFEELSRQARPDRVARATAIADRNLEGSTPEQEGHVSVIVLPARAWIRLPEQPVTWNETTKTFTLNRTSAAVALALAAPPAKSLNREVLRSLDERRLITTIVHVVGPPASSLRLDLALRALPGVNAETLAQTVGKAVAGFLDPYEGWRDGRGWPYGRNVYRTELYQFVESLEGIDHVTKLVMNGDATGSKIVVAENSIVCLDALTVTASA